MRYCPYPASTLYQVSLFSGKLALAESDSETISTPTIGETVGYLNELCQSLPVLLLFHVPTTNIIMHTVHMRHLKKHSQTYIPKLSTQGHLSPST